MRDEPPNKRLELTTARWQGLRAVAASACSGATSQDGLRLRSGYRNLGRMERGTARLWREADRWAIQIEIDGVPYTERDYADIASASQAIAQILRQHAERSTDMDQRPVKPATNRWIS